MSRRPARGPSCRRSGCDDELGRSQGAETGRRPPRSRRGGRRGGRGSVRAGARVEPIAPGRAGWPAPHRPPRRRSRPRGHPDHQRLRRLPPRPRAGGSFRGVASARPPAGVAAATGPGALSARTPGAGRAPDPGPDDPREVRAGDGDGADFLHGAEGDVVLGMGVQRGRHAEALAGAARRPAGSGCFRRSARSRRAAPGGRPPTAGCGAARPGLVQRRPDQSLDTRAVEPQQVAQAGQGDGQHGIGVGGQRLLGLDAVAAQPVQSACGLGVVGVERAQMIAEQARACWNSASSKSMPPRCSMPSG